MTILHLHRDRTPLPMWAPVDTSGHVTFDPSLQTARELMRAHGIAPEFLESWLRHPSSLTARRETRVAS